MLSCFTARIMPLVAIPCVRDSSAVAPAARIRVSCAVKSVSPTGDLRTEFEIEIGAAFGPLAGKLWRIGAMGINARKHAVLTTLAALEAVLRNEGFGFSSGAGVDAAMAVYAEAGP